MIKSVVMRAHRSERGVSLAETLVALFILAVVGAAIIGGVYYKIEFLGTGFMFSGIFLMFFGTIQNFNELNKWTRPIVLLLELGLILFIAYKKVVQRETPKKKELSKN